MEQERNKLGSYKTVDGRLSLFEVAEYESKTDVEFKDHTESISLNLELTLKGEPIEVMPIGFATSIDSFVELFNYHQKMHSTCDETRADIERLYHEISGTEDYEEGVDISETDEPGYSPKLIYTF